MAEYLEDLDLGADTGAPDDRFNGFLGEVRLALRRLHYAFRTEKTYMDWIRRFLVFGNPKSRDNLDSNLVKEYLNYLASVRKVSAKTQNQALNALVFMFREVMGRESIELEGVTRAAERRRLPVDRKSTRLNSSHT